jgi:hypothetical protein
MPKAARPLAPRQLAGLTPVVTHAARSVICLHLRGGWNHTLSVSPFTMSRRHHERVRDPPDKASGIPEGGIVSPKTPDIRMGEVRQTVLWPPASVDRRSIMDPRAQADRSTGAASSNWSDTMPTTTRLSALLTVVLVAGCKGHETRPANRDTTQDPPAVIESPGALAARHEAQESLDQARAAFEQKQYETMRAEFADAAAFLRTEAQETEGDAGAPLRRAATELDSLATRVATGGVPTARAVDRALINTNRAEARYHLLRAGDAIANGDNRRAGEELSMSVDHLERAAKDAGRPSDAAVRTAVADARTLAGEMMKGMGAVPDEAWRVTEQLERVIDRTAAGVRERIRRKP